MTTFWQCKILPPGMYVNELPEALKSLTDHSLCHKERYSLSTLLLGSMHAVLRILGMPSRRPRTVLW